MTAVYTHRASAYTGSGAKDRALADFDAALKADPSDPFVYVSRGNLYQDEGQLDRAIADYDRAIMADRSYADAFNNRGSAFARKATTIAPLWTSTRRLRSTPSCPMCSPIAACLPQDRTICPGVADLDKALVRNARDASSLYNRGVAKQQAGDKPGGDADVAKARAMDSAVGH